MRLQLGISSIERERGDQPRAPVINMLPERTRTDEAGIVLQSRLGLTDRGESMGTGPIEQLFKADGVLNGALFGVSAGMLYEGTVSKGTIPGSNPVSMAGNEVGLMVTAGSTLRYWNGTALSNVVFPDSANVLKVLGGASRFIALRRSSGKFYWTPPLGTTFNALAFATAESTADYLVDAVFMDDTLILGGVETIEFWANTTDANLPFQPVQGRVFNRGVKQTGCMVRFDTTFAWVGNDNIVYVNGPERISDEGIEEKIAATTNCRLFTFLSEGIEYLALRVDAGTWIYRGGMWSEMRSYGQANWIPQCFDGGVFGSAIDGRTIAFTNAYQDFGGEMERRFRAGTPLPSGGPIISNMTLITNPGQTSYLSGEYADPIVEARISRDNGQTWGNWKPQSLGQQGKYRAKVQWRGLGMASAPSFFAEFRTTAPVPFRVTGVTVNEPLGGRW